MTGDEADVQGQSKGEESLSQRLPISYSLLDPQPQRQSTAVALQGLKADPNSQPGPSPCYSEGADQFSYLPHHRSCHWTETVFRVIFEMSEHSRLSGQNSIVCEKS